ncbi:MAG: hypothetical protein U1F65_03390 [Verrucomicrobiota bacterium]
MTKLFQFRALPLMLGVAMALLVLPAYATDFYVSQSGTGAGTSPSDTLSLAWLKTPGRWGTGAGKINPGDTVHLVGVFTNGLTLGSGAPGRPVTVLFEPDAKLSRPVWGITGNAPIYATDVHDVIIDGGVNGTIECTSNGLGKNYSNHMNAVEINVAGSLEIKNLIITNIYFRTNSTDETASCQGIVVSGVMTNVLIHNNWIEMVGNAIIVGSCSGYCTNVQVYSNRLERISWGCFVNVNDPNFYGVGFQIWGNRMDHFDAWDTPQGASGVFHQDGIYPNIHPATQIVYDGSSPTATYDANGRYNIAVNNFSRYIWRPLSANDISLLDGTNVISTWASFGTVTNIVTLTGLPNKPVTANLVYVYGGTNYEMRIHGNYIGPNIGRTMSGPIYIAPDFNGLPNAMVYNNLIVIGPGQGCANGFVTMTGDGVIANNTFVSQAANPSGYILGVNGANIKMYNNLSYNVAQSVFINQFNVSPGFPMLSMGASDYNIYYRLTEWQLGQGAWPRLYASAGYSRPPFETHSNTNKPAVTPGYVPLSSDTIARGMGKNLSTYFSTDINGNARPATGPWTIGAFEVPFTGTPLIAPSNLSVTNN